MELILLSKVQNLGGLGDRVTVRPGYGRNYLVPQGLAVPATEKNLEAFEERRAELERKAREELAGAEARREAIDGAEIQIRANASGEGKLYGSVAARDIAEALTEAGYPVERSEIVLREGPIRYVGEHEEDVQLHPDVTATVRVVVTST